MNLRKTLYPVLAAVSICPGSLFSSCHNDNGKDEYIIKGTTSQTRLNGKKVLLVPFGKPGIRDSIGTDSAYIKDGKFEIRGNRGKFLARVTIEINERFGTQDLLVVTEPGVINVVIDSVSSGNGTPQNDLLQQWKDLKTDHDRVQWNQSQHIKYLREQGDTVYAAALSDSLRQFNDRYMDSIRDILRRLGSGPAYDFIHNMYGDPE